MRGAASRAPSKKVLVGHPLGHLPALPTRSSTFGFNHSQNFKDHGREFVAAPSLRPQRPLLWRREGKGTPATGGKGRVGRLLPRHLRCDSQIFEVIPEVSASRLCSRCSRSGAKPCKALRLDQVA